MNVVGKFSHSPADLKGDQGEVKGPYRSHKWSRKAIDFDFENYSFRSQHDLGEGPG
jgi:hypothetical protein